MKSNGTAINLHNDMLLTLVKLLYIKGDKMLVGFSHNADTLTVSTFTLLLCSS